MSITGVRLTREIADYHALIAADIKDFTINSDTDNRILASRLPQVLSDAFARSGLDFSCVRFPGQAGDGYVAGLDYHQLPYLIHPLLDRLQDVLTERDAEFRAHSRGLRMRLRASIHIGPLPDDDDPADPAGIGKPMNDVHRLLDAEPVRDALRHTDPDTTFVAAVISQRAYEDAIQSGACALPTSRLIPIRAQVKKFSGEGWLYVPQPSGQALHRAFLRDDDEPHGEEAPASQAIRGLGPAAGSGTPMTSGPKFHIGAAGQVADTATGPVSIHQVIHGGADLVTNLRDVSQPSTHTESSPRLANGESS